MNTNTEICVCVIKHISVSKSLLIDGTRLSFHWKSVTGLSHFSHSYTMFYCITYICWKISLNKSEKNNFIFVIWFTFNNEKSCVLIDESWIILSFYINLLFMFYSFLRVFTTDNLFIKCMRLLSTYSFNVVVRSMSASSLNFAFLWVNAGWSLSSKCWGDMLPFSRIFRSISCAFSLVVSLLSPT